MVTKKYPWLTAFGASIACHALIIVLIGVLASLHPSMPKDNGPLQVDLVSMEGGGGDDGDLDEDTDEPETPEEQEDEQEPLVPADFDADEKAVNDVH